MAVLLIASACWADVPRRDDGDGYYVPHSVPGMNQTAMDGCATDSCSGPSAGDPVNLATLEEEYTPEADISVYNPKGPDVVWRRIYNSLRSTTENNDQYGAARDLADDYGRGWSHGYNYYLVYSNNKGVIVLPNKGRIKFDVPQGYVSGSKIDPQFGASCVLYSTASSGFRVRWSDGSQMLFDPNPNFPNHYRPTRLTDATGHYISFAYTSGTLQRLQYIRDEAGATLLEIRRDDSGTPHISSVIDQTSQRAVSYFFAANGLSGAGFLDSLTYIYVPGQPSGSKFHYEYKNYADSGGRTAAMLWKIYRRSPQIPRPDNNIAWSVATITYGNDLKVSEIKDANNNRRVYTISGDKTKVEIYNATDAQPVYRNYVRHDSTRLNQSESRDANDNVLMTTVYGVENVSGENPFRPKTITRQDQFPGSGVRTLSHSYKWDRYGNLTERTSAPEPSSPYEYIIRYQYDYSDPLYPAGSLIGRSFTQGGIVRENAQEAYTFSRGNLVYSNLPSPGLETGAPTVPSNYSYNTYGDLTTATIPGKEGETRTTSLDYGYDAWGNFTQNPIRKGQPLVMSDNASHKTHFRYDGLGRVIENFDHFGHVYNYEYNTAGQVTKVLFPLPWPAAPNLNGRAYAIYRYDYPGGPLRRTELYDEAGTGTRGVDYNYGPEGEILSTSGDTAETATTEYDALYRVRKLTDARGNVTTYQYNVVGNLDSITYPGNDGDKTEFLAYDRLGRPVTVRDGKGQTIQYRYNGPEWELSSITYPSVNPYPDHSFDGRYTVDIKYQFVATGFKVNVKDAWSERNSIYNWAGALTFTDASHWAGLYKTVYQYHPDGARRAMNVTSNKFSDVYSFTYDYDSAGNLSSVTNPFSQMTAYVYAENDWLRYQSVTANGSMVYSSDINYDAYGRLMTLSYSRNNSQILRYQGLYNASTNPQSVIEYSIPGNRKQVDTFSPLNFSGLNFNGLTSYTYGNNDRVQWEGSSRYNGWQNNFAYDAAGNLKDRSVMTGGAWANRDHNAKNQPIVSDFIYDKNGNKTGSDQFGTVSYDWTDNATQFVSQSRFGVNQYGYSSDGLPVWRQGTHVPMRYLIYDGKDPILEVDTNGAARAINTFGANGLISRAVITPGTGAALNSGTTDESDAKTDLPPAPPALPYMGPGGTTSLGAMIPLADSQTGKQSGGSSGTQAATGGTVNHIFYLFDERGNTALRLDASGNMLSAHITDAYGMTIDRDYSTVAGSWVEDPYAGMGAQFGYYREAYLDSYRCGLRLYEMYSARWLTRDPIGYGGGQNLYGYVGGNPIMGTDPVGLADTWEQWVGEQFTYWLAGKPLAEGTSTLANAASANAATMRELTSGEDVGGTYGAMCSTQNRLAPAGKQVGKFANEALGTTILAVATGGVRKPTQPSNLGMNNAPFGTMIGWGDTGLKARARMGTLTKAEIETMGQQGLTPGLARQWAAFYRQFDRWAKANRKIDPFGNPEARARLMRKIATMLSKD